MDNDSELSQMLPKVGYWWSDKKSKKIKVDNFVEYCRAAGFDLVKINLNEPIESQGPFIAIVHKVSDLIIKAEQGDEQFQAIYKAFQEYCDSHKEVVIIDPLPNIYELLDRYRQYKFADDPELRNYGGVFIPAFVELTSTDIVENANKMKTANVTFPCVCKPIIAHTALSHGMYLVFNEEGLKDITLPCVAQTFVNHNAILYKIFILGNHYFVINRPSLKNFNAGDSKTIFFESHNISKPNSVSELTELDESEPKTPPIQPNKDQMNHIVQVLCKKLGMSLFGVDVIIDRETGDYGIIDVNVFPGYDEVENFYQLLTNLIIEKITLNKRGVSYISKPILSNPKWKPRALNFCNWKKLSADFDATNVVPNKSVCFCCPISGECHNAKKSIKESPKGKHEKFNGSTELSFSLNDASFENKDKNFETKNTKSEADNAQDDSGIETSDSCDEKKIGTILRNVKRQHSKSHQTTNLEKFHFS